jgi:hypothetical protein
MRLTSSFLVDLRFLDSLINLSIVLVRTIPDICAQWHSQFKRLRVAFISPMDSIIVIPFALAALFALAMYLVLLHLKVTNIKSTSTFDGVNAIYKVIAPENLSCVYAGSVVHLCANRLFYSDATASPLEDDTASVLSELTDISEPRTPGDSEDPDIESEIEVSSAPLALHRLTFASVRFLSLR